MHKCYLHRLRWLGGVMDVIGGAQDESVQGEGGGG